MGLSFNPTINTRNPGLAFQDGDDFLGSMDINSTSTRFVRSVNPIDSTRKFITNIREPYSHNASADEILIKTSNFTAQVDPLSSPRTSGLFRLPTLPFPYFQPVPNLGLNPTAAEVMSATTQFQADLRTVGPGAIPGFPVVNMGTHSGAMGFMGQTDAFINAMIPYQPGATPQGAFYPAANGGGTFFPAPPIQAPFPGATPSYYPMFAPFSGIGVTPSQIPYPPSAGIVTAPNGPISYPAYPWLQYASQQPNQNQMTTQGLAQLFRSNTAVLPNYFPATSYQQIHAFLSEYNNLPEYAKVQVRQQLANPTQVNASILNRAGITGTGGQYDKGVVTNPFRSSNFLTDTNPFADFNTGIVVTDGNSNGKVKGTPTRDILFGTHNRNNIIDGRGGEDDIIGSVQRDMVNVSHGDRVFTDGGDDLMFYGFNTSIGRTTRSTVVDGGAGNDILVLTVNGNPQAGLNQPTFTRLSDGSIRITHNNLQLLTRNIEKFYVADSRGNIGQTYAVKA